jgi:hypothetical protein
MRFTRTPNWCNDISAFPKKTNEKGSQADDKKRPMMNVSSLLATRELESSSVRGMNQVPSVGCSVHSSIQVYHNIHGSHQDLGGDEYNYCAS